MNTCHVLATVVRDLHELILTAASELGDTVKATWLLSKVAQLVHGSASIHIDCFIWSRQKHIKISTAAPFYTGQNGKNLVTHPRPCGQ